jgi:hypothetical protein
MCPSHKFVQLGFVGLVRIFHSYLGRSQLSHGDYDAAAKTRTLTPWSRILWDNRVS